MSFKLLFLYWKRECVSMGEAGAQTRRSLGHHLLHPQILRLLVLLKPADFEAQSSLLQNRLHLQIQIPNACPEYCPVIFSICTFKGTKIRLDHTLHPIFLYFFLFLAKQSCIQNQNSESYTSERDTSGQHFLLFGKNWSYFFQNLLQSWSLLGKNKHENQYCQMFWNNPRVFEP